MKKIFCLICFAIFAISMGNAQQISVDEEPGVTKLMNKYLSKNQMEETVQAYRIQIITTSDRREMSAVKAKFEREQPHMKVDWEHVPPYYKVAVGAFRDKISCNSFLANLKRSFPLAIPVVDNIAKSELLK